MTLKFSTSQGQYLRYVSMMPRLTEAKERREIQRLQSGEGAALTDLIQASLYRVVQIAKKYARQRVPLMDLVSEGNMALMEAGDAFDPEKDGLFSKYAEGIIRKRIEKMWKTHNRTSHITNPLDSSTESLAHETQDEGDRSWLVDDVLSELLDVLGRTERQYIESYFGLKEGVPLSYAATGKNLGNVTFTTSRTVVHAALLKMLEAFIRSMRLQGLTIAKWMKRPTQDELNRFEELIGKRRVRMLLDEFSTK